MKSKIIRTITLLFFVALISAFVGYRSGLTDEFLQLGDSRGDSYTAFQPDTLPKNDSAKNRLMLPSSKSMIVPKRRFRSFKPRSQSTSKTDSAILIRELIGSSKSGVIIKPKIESDTVDNK